MLDVDDGTLSVRVIYRLPLLFSHYGQKDTIASSSGNPGNGEEQCDIIN